MRGSVAGAVLDTARRHACDRGVVGVSAPTGAARFVLDVAADAVLRLGDVPVLTVRAGSTPPPVRPYGDCAVVAVDAPAPAQAALAVSADRVAAYVPAFEAVTAVDVDAVDASADAAGLDAAPAAAQARADAHRLLDQELAAARFNAPPGRIVEGRPGSAIVRAARERRAGLTVIGSHGGSGRRVPAPFPLVRGCREVYAPRVGR